MERNAGDGPGRRRRADTRDVAYDGARSGTRGVLAVIGSGAGAVTGLRTGLVEPALARGWRVAVTLTPTAGRWLRDSGEAAAIEELTGLPVRDRPRRTPSDPRPHPDPDAVAVAPATANTVAKLALGIQDNQALTVAATALGTRGVPVAVFPTINAANARHPAWHGHLAALRAAGARLLYDDARWPLREPDAPAPRPPWSSVLDLLDEGR